jgi:glutathione S-transferase
MEGLLPDEGYALGSFSIADCSLAPALYRTTNTAMDLSPYPRTRRLRDALMARPAFAAAMPVL